MITAKIYQNALKTPEKVALSYRGVKTSYAELVDLVSKAREALAKTGFSTFIFQADPLETLVVLLASNLNGQRVIVLPKDIKPDEVNQLEKEHNALYLSSLKDIPENHSSTKNSETSFLGILTSGSEGKSKVIWKTNDNWESAFEHQSRVFGIHKNDRIFTLDAFGYSANLNSALHGLWLGATIVLGRLKEAGSWSKDMIREDISSVFLVPSHARLLLKSNLTLSGVSSFVTAGEKLDASTAKGLMSKFPVALITEYYGAAELGHISYHQNQDILENLAAVGKAFPGVKVEIKGEKINVESPYVSPDFKEIATVNDLGYFEGDRLILLGREGRMFNRRGLNIFAQEIENQALSSGLILEAALIRSIDGRKLTLFFTPVRDFEGDVKEDLRAYLDHKLPKSKQPNFFEELKEMPHSEAGKIDFKALSKMNEEELTV